MERLKKKLILDFTTLLFYKNYVVSTANDDVSIENNDWEKLQVATKEFYQNELFGYIINRKNQYSLDPLIYFRVSKVSRLVGVAAVVYNSSLKEMTVSFEKKFLAKPFHIFDDMRPAMTWMEGLVEQKRNELFA